MNVYTKSLIVALSAVTLASCGANQQQGPGFADENAVTKVSIYSASYQDVPQFEVYSTTVQANVINNVVPQSGNRIAKIRAEVGDFVSAGQILAEMDRVNLTQTELKLANDSTELSRMKELYEEGGISLSDYQQIELAYNVSRSSYQNLLENTILRSPISGVVTARNYDKGDMYAMSTPIYVVQQITPVKLLVGISEKDYTKVSKGDKVQIEAEAIPDRVFEGKVERIYPTVDPASHTFTVEVIVPNNDRVLRPGMYAKVTVTFGINNSIVIPDSGINKLQGSNQKSVFVVNADNTVSTKVVTLGRHIDSSYEILSGLEDGDKVVVKGQTSLRDGDPVEF